MSDSKLLWLALLLFSALASAQDSSEAQSSEPTDDTSSEVSAEAKADETATPAQPSPGVKTLSGMSILGNEEAPKSLVIVPWKSSEIGNGVSVNDVIDERARPVDKDVFLREIHYYELRSGRQP